MSDAPDTATPPQEHPYKPPEDKPWGLCVVCGYGQASHNEGAFYKSDAPRAPEGAERTGA
jgi:hypothetical protein